MLIFKIYHLIIPYYLYYIFNNYYNFLILIIQILLMLNVNQIIYLMLNLKIIQFSIFPLIKDQSFIN